MLDPFQRLFFCKQQGEKPHTNIVLASGASIYLLDALDGKYRASWSPSYNSIVKEPELISQQDVEGNFETEPPGKRLKLSPPIQKEQSSSKVSARKENGTKPKAESYSSPSIVKLCGTDNGEHIVAVTGEDKSIHVFSLSEIGALEHLSQRAMPKRPNALSFTDSQSTILCGDKFGDVYAIPLLENDLSPQVKAFYADSVEDKRDRVLEPYKPAANSFTIHTKRNQEALKMQQNVNAVRSQKPEISFDHKLLLGHVSLLTDVISATISVGETKRNYILTSDRDEHIRVSRGIPQTHIIEGFCLGHTEFVSKMCIPSWNPELLVSGGGDDYLMTWDWVSGESKQKFKLRDAIESAEAVFRSEVKPDEGFEDIEISISGIWAMKTGNGKEGQIIVTFEGIPAIVTLHLGLDRELRHQQILKTTYNVLDVTIDESNSRIIYSLDNFHCPFSTSNREESRSGPFIGIHGFSDNSQCWNDECDGPLASAVNAWSKTQKSSSNEANINRLSDLFYSTGKLRKRGNEDSQAEV